MEAKVIIFDLYDTLLYCPDKRNPYISFFRQLGLTKGEMSNWINKVMTQNYESFEVIKNEINSDLDIDLTPFQNHLNEEIQSTRLFDDTNKTLERLSQKYRLFCLSNLATPYKTCYFEQGLDKWIEKPFFSCDIGLKKPNPDFFKMVVDFSGVPANQMIMIGDSQTSDYDGALNAGIRAILKDKSLAEVTINL
jgi:HAD superfamily hydrolase (TIGR01549 family)